MGSQRAGHDWATNTHTHTHTLVKTRDRNEGGRADRGQLTRGLEAVCGGSLYLTSLVHFLCHVCKFFLNISLMCIFLKKSFPRQYCMMKLLLLTQYLGSRRDSAIIGYIPSGALASILIFWPCSQSLISEARSQSVCGAAFSVKPRSLLKALSHQCHLMSSSGPSLIPGFPPHWSISGFQRNTFLPPQGLCTHGSLCL